MLRTGLQLVKAGLSLTFAPGRSERAKFALAQMRWLGLNRIPTEYLIRLFPEVAGVRSPMTPDISHHFELPYGERAVIAALVKALEPSAMFEFGTFTGATTKLLADAAPNATIQTLDLPAAEMKREPWIAEVVGMAFRDDRAYSDRIVQHRENSKRFDFSPLQGQYDLVFVDASHEFEDVLHDSRRALEIARKDGGVVIWDDYQPQVTGVVEALNQIHDEGVQLARVAHTRLVVHRMGGFPVPLEPNEMPWALSPRRGRPGEEHG